MCFFLFFFSSRRRHTRSLCDWSSDVCSSDLIREVAREAKARGIPIRVGANAGSLHTDFLKKHGGPKPEALVESAMWEVALLERSEERRVGKEGRCRWSRDE